MKYGSVTQNNSLIHYNQIKDSRWSFLVEFVCLFISRLIF